MEHDLARADHRNRCDRQSVGLRDRPASCRSFLRESVPPRGDESEKLLPTFPMARQKTLPMLRKAYARIDNAESEPCPIHRRNVSASPSPVPDRSAALPGVRQSFWRKECTASFTLITALGYEIYPCTKRRIAGSPTAVVAAIFWFLSRVRSFRELLATGRAGCCALIETLVAAGRLVQPPVDVSDIQAMKPS